MNKLKRLKEIGRVIQANGIFTYTVSGGGSPRYLYSIGLYEEIGLELLFAGASYFTANQAKKIVDVAATVLKSNISVTSFNVEGVAGEFDLCNVDRSWSTELPLGAIDYYNTDCVKLIQILPPDAFNTIDIPDCSLPMSDNANRVWKWFNLGYPDDLPKSCVAITNLDALRGQAVTEVMRWEVDQWEIFSGAGSDVVKDDVRAVELSTLVLYDPSLAQVMQLCVGTGVWRDKNMIWNNWK